MEFITATEIQTRTPDNWEQNVILLCPKFLIFLGLIMRVLIISYYYYYYSWLFHLLFSEQAVLSNLCLFSMRLILFPVVRTLHILVISLWMAVDLPMFTLDLWQAPLFLYHLLMTKHFHFNGAQLVIFFLWSALYFYRRKPSVYWHHGHSFTFFFLQFGLLCLRT